MRIAIPVMNEELSAHFGHCDQFALFDIDPTAKSILGRESVPAPPHQPGLLPQWLAKHGADVIIAAGMGQRARDLFAEQGIQVVVGASTETPEHLVDNFLADALEVGENFCDH